VTQGLPQIREGEAPAGLAAVYVDIRHVLRLSYVPLLFRAAAATPGAMRAVWPRLRPAFAVRAFEEAADDLRAHLATAAVDLGTPLIEPVLAAAGFDEDDVDEVRQQIDLFHYADAKVMLSAVVLARALEGHRVGGGHVRPALAVPVPDGVPADMPMPEPVPQRGRGIAGEVLRDILRATHLPAGDADLHALGRWPGFLDLAWRELSSVLRGDRHEHAVRRISDEAERLTRHLPVAVEIPAGTLDGPAMAATTRLAATMCDALPRLALLGAALKVALDGAEDALDSPFPVDWDVAGGAAIEEEAEAPGAP